MSKMLYVKDVVCQRCCMSTKRELKNEPFIVYIFKNLYLGISSILVANTSLNKPNTSQKFIDFCSLTVVERDLARSTSCKNCKRFAITMHSQTVSQSY